MESYSISQMGRTEGREMIPGYESLVLILTHVVFLAGHRTPLWKTSLGNHGREVTVTYIRSHGNALA